jgi:hypothetical protein
MAGCTHAAFLVFTKKLGRCAQLVRVGGDGKLPPIYGP